jgi:hypothetical protein
MVFIHDQKGIRHKRIIVILTIFLILEGFLILLLLNNLQIKGKKNLNISEKVKVLLLFMNYKGGIYSHSIVAGGLPEIS